MALDQINSLCDAAENWFEIFKGLPSGFGFPMAAHPQESETFCVVPERGDFFRVAANRDFSVYETSNVGRTWKKLNNGLPTKNAHLGCHREGSATDHLETVGLYVGTRMGQLFSSVNERKSWQLSAMATADLLRLSSYGYVIIGS